MYRKLMATLILWVLVMGAVQGSTTPRPSDETQEQGGFSDTHVFPGDYNTSAPFSRVLQDGPLAMMPAQVVHIPSPIDQVPIEILLLRPETDARVPVIASASPYFPPLEGQSIRSTNLRFLHENFLPHGYAIAMIAVRGTAGSGGCMDLMGAKEQADLDAAVTWLGTQAWSNGNVAMFGASYSGSTPWEVAATGNPHLRTIVPIAGINDLYHLLFRNGTNDVRWPLVTPSYYAKSLEMESESWQSGQWAYCPESWKGVPALVESAMLGERDSLGYWTQRNHRPGTEANYDGSVFFIQGFDDLQVRAASQYPWIDRLQEQGVPVKTLLGQWGHDWPDRPFRPEHEDDARLDWAEILLRWFDYWLKDQGEVDIGPRVQVQDNQGHWRSSDAWPPADAVTSRLYLGPDNQMTSMEPTGTADYPIAFDATRLGLVEEDRSNYPDMPYYPVLDSMQEVCPSCPSFIGAPLTEELRMAGVPRVHLTITPLGPTGHVSGWLYAVNGTVEKPIGFGQIDLRFAHGGEEMRPVVPGQPLLVKMVLAPLDVVVDPGERLKLVISQGTYQAYVPSHPPFPAILNTGGTLSTFEYETFVPSPDSFFVPPCREDGEPRCS